MRSQQLLIVYVYSLLFCSSGKMIAYTTGENCISPTCVPGLQLHDISSLVETEPCRQIPDSPLHLLNTQCGFDTTHISTTGTHVYCQFTIEHNIQQVENVTFFAMGKLYNSVQTDKYRLGKGEFPLYGFDVNMNTPSPITYEVQGYVPEFYWKYDSFRLKIKQGKRRRAVCMKFKKAWITNEYEHDQGDTIQQWNAAIAASAGTTMEPVTVVPPKGESGTRRRLRSSPGASTAWKRLAQLASPASHLHRMKIQSAEATDPDTLSLLSDYMMQPEPFYVVDDPSAEAVNAMNKIICYINQLRGKEIGINTEEGNPNPDKLPYVALVDTSICEDENYQTTMQEWIVQATGPAGGDGFYVTQIFFDLFPGMPLYGQISRNISAGEVVTSKLVYVAGGGYLRGGIMTDRTDPLSTKIKFLEQYSQSDGNHVMAQEMNKHLRKKSRSLASKSGGAQPTSHIVLKTNNEKQTKKLQRMATKELVKAKKTKLQTQNKMISRKLQSNGEVYLSVEFNPTEGAIGQLGQAITYDGDREYKIAFSDTAVVRVDDMNNGACLDYRNENAINIYLDYVLFNANDGSRSLFSSGTVIEKVVGSNTYNAYISNWGAHVFDKYDHDTQEQVSQPDWLIDGATVKKMGYSSSGDEEHTLRVAPGRLTNVKNMKVPLKDIKDVPLSVFKGGSVDRKIAWDGTNLKTVENLVTQCIQRSEDYDSYSVISTDPDHEIFCFCYENDGTTARTVGDFNFGSRLEHNQKRTVLNPSEAFNPTSEEFSNGIEIRTDALWGKLNLKYEKIQKLWMWPPGTYTAGDVVTQASTGASGTVSISTPTIVKGWSCASASCLNYTTTWPQDCGGFHMYVNTWHGLFPGLILTQSGAGVVAKVVTHSWSLEYDGFGVEFTTGSAFVSSEDIVVSYPTTPTSGILSEFTDVVGTLTKQSSIVLSHEVYVTQGDGCTANMYVDGIMVKNGNSDITGSNIALYIDSDGEAHGWFNNIASGQTCDPSTVNVKATDIATALSGAGITCNSNPSITVLCTTSHAAISGQLTVKLDTESTKFAREDSWPPPSTTKLNIGGAEFNPPGWVENIRGEVKPVTEETTVTFRIEKTVNPGATVPELLCYENCPNPNAQSGNNMESCIENDQTNDCYYPRPSHLSDHAERTSEGECTSTSNDLVAVGTLPSGQFDNIVDAQATITWEMSDDGSGQYKYTPTVEITNRGHTCTSDIPPTFMLNDMNLVCGGGSMATFTLHCEEGTDTNSFNQAHLYDFDAASGALTDKVAGRSAAIGASNSEYYSSSPTDHKPTAHFGPFVPNLSAEKQKLLCEWNDELVCIWQAYEQLDNIYFYQSGQQGRRFTLTASDGKSVHFQSSLNLIYTHSGTASNSGKNYDGSKSLLSYEGPGRLSGLPTFCLDEKTGLLSSECVPEGHTNSTKNGFDINIDPTAVLMDTDGNKYYAKSQIVTEVYPKVGDQNHALCSGLILPSDSSGVAKPSMEDIYDDPGHLGEPVPTKEDLLNGGEPAVIAGSTLRELRDAAMALEAA